MRRSSRPVKYASLLAFVTMLALALTACGSGSGGNGSNAPENSGSNAAASGKDGDAAATAGAPAQNKDITVRIGYQKYGTINILKADGALDKKLAEQGIKIEWTEFPGGPQLLEALNVGSIDIGHTGEAPPVFAQAAGAPLVYLAHEPASPQSEGILVPKDSAIQSVADLKGKKVALNKGSNVH